MKDLRQRIVAAWYRPFSWTLLLLPLSWLFRGISALRRYYLSHRQPTNVCPLIVVGNVTLGGTGKTPLVSHLARLLIKEGYQVGIVSRGYGRVNPKNRPLLVTTQSHAAQVGDEPLMLFQQIGCPIAVDADRVSAIHHLLHHFPAIQIVLSDDGLQHYKMAREIEIGVVNGLKQYGNGHCLPAGPLREPLSRINQLDYCLATHQAQAGEILFSYHPQAFVSLEDPQQRIPYQEHSFTTVHAIAAIGTPQAFFASLEKMNIQIIPHVYPDHYLFNPQDFVFSDDYPIIMTEKDAVKCRAFPKKNQWYLALETTLPEQFEREFLHRVKGLCYGKEII